MKEFKAQYMDSLDAGPQIKHSLVIINSKTKGPEISKN